MSQCSNGRNGRTWRQSLQTFLLSQLKAEFLSNALKKYHPIKHAVQNSLTPTLRDDLEEKQSEKSGADYAHLNRGDWQGKLNEKDKYKRGNSGSNENIETTGSFLLRSLEHNPTSLKTFLALVLALPVCGIFIGGFVSSRATMSLIGDRLEEGAPKILQSVFDQLSSIRIEIGRIQTRDESQEKRIDKLEDKK